MPAWVDVPAKPAAHHVDVAVDEPGHDPPPVDIDRPGVRGEVSLHLVISPRGQDLASCHRDRLAPIDRPAVPELAGMEDQIGW